MQIHYIITSFKDNFAYFVLEMAWQRSIGSSYCMVYVGLGLGWLALLHMLHRQMFSRALCVVKTRYVTNLLMNLKKA